MSDSFRQGILHWLYGPKSLIFCIKNTCHCSQGIYSWFSIRSRNSLRLDSQRSRLRQVMRQMIVYLSTLILGTIALHHQWLLLSLLYRLTRATNNTAALSHMPLALACTAHHPPTHPLHVCKINDNPYPFLCPTTVLFSLARCCLVLRKETYERVKPLRPLSQCKY